MPVKTTPQKAQIVHDAMRDSLAGATGQGRKIRKMTRVTANAFTVTFQTGETATITVT